MAKQTAVEWMVNGLLVSNYISKDSKVMNAFIKKAKAMEIEHLEDCWIAAEQSKDSQTFFNYYNETYNK